MTPAADYRGNEGHLIYVVDDEAVIAELIRLNLEARRFRVKVFDSGERMLDCLSRDRPDLIILDVMLPPGANGVEIAGQVRENSQVPILMLSVMDQTPTKLLALNIGADDYLTKPFEVDELVARVRAILRRAAITKE
ncbi:MAG: response regulator transcription factor, partial [Dehalococcoidia bacterium]